MVKFRDLVPTASTLSCIVFYHCAICFGFDFASCAFRIIMSHIGHAVRFTTKTEYLASCMALLNKILRYSPVENTENPSIMWTIFPFVTSHLV